MLLTRRVRPPGLKSEPHHRRRDLGQDAQLDCFSFMTYKLSIRKIFTCQGFPSRLLERTSEAEERHPVLPNTGNATPQASPGTPGPSLSLLQEEAQLGED